MVSMLFSINCEWLPSEIGDSDERSTFAEIEIGVRGHCATKVEDTFAKTVRSYARLSALELAEWLAFNWWRLLWEPESNGYSWKASHKVGNAGGGYVWPDLSFSSDWHSVLVSARPTTHWDAEPIRYLNRLDELPVPIANFESVASDFIDRTIARLSIMGNAQSELSALWDEVTCERQDVESANRRILEACMGYDPDEAPSDFIDYLIEQTSPYGEGAIREMAAAYKEEAVSHARSIRESALKSAMTARVPNRADIRGRLASQSAASDIPPWVRAESAARIARDSWDVSVPVSTNAICDVLSVSQDRFLDVQDAGETPLTAGVREDVDSNAFHVALSGRHPHSRRFRLARLVADHIDADDGETLLPATSSKTSRQKFQRAFAQELLCPFDHLREYLGDETPNDDAIHDAAEYYDVSPVTVLVTLVNKGVLGRDSLNNMWAAV